MLDRQARERLRSLSKEGAELVGAHLAAAGLFFDEQPERSYEHARFAVSKAGRIDVAREALGLAAYRTGRYDEALRELRTVRRLNGSSEHLAVMADCERGLGRPERALALVDSEEARSLTAPQRAELAMVASGARGDLAEYEAGLAVLDDIHVPSGASELQQRIAEARSVLLDRAGRPEDAARVRAAAGIDGDGAEPEAVGADTVVVYEEEAAEAPQEPREDTRLRRSSYGRDERKQDGPRGQ